MKIVEVRERCRCNDEELPVIYFLSTRARVEPAAIINLRIGNMSWFEIALHYRLLPDVFFVSFGGDKHRTALRQGLWIL